MKTYKIVGTHRVCGHEPGCTVDVDELAGADVDHLIEAGHITPITPITTKATKATPAPTIQED